jgi:type I restriction enzyme, S subunit
MKQTPLSQLAIVSAGQAAPKDDEFADHGTPFVRAGSLDSLLSGKTELDLELVSDETAKLRKLKTYPKGTILFAKSGMSATKDRIYLLQNPAYVVSHLATLIPNSNAHADYLRLALKRFPPSVLIKDAAYPAISLGDIQSYEIPVPDQFDDQIRIAHLLGKVEGLIAQRKQHLRQLDDLLKSTFLEMFGDIRAKKSNHPWKALRPYLKAHSGKSSKNVISDEETGIPIFGGNGINGWAVKALYETPVVVAGRVGQQCGVIHVSKGPCWVTDNAIVLSIEDDKRLNIVYLAKAFHYAPIRERVKQLDLPFINQSMLLDYPLPLPPIEQQNLFAAIVEKIERVKSRYQQSLTDLEVLYGALSQQAFKGELDFSGVALPTDFTQPMSVDASKPITEVITPTELVRPLVQSAEPQGRDQLLTRWFQQYLANTPPATGLRSAQILEGAWQALQTAQLEVEVSGEEEEVEEEEEFPDLADYDTLKALVFKALDAGELLLTFDDDRNRVALKRQSTEWGTW